MEPEQIQKRMAELWARHLPEIAERVRVLERTCSTLETGKLSEEERKVTSAAAHKLAGALGTFGRTRGTELAREVERMLDGGSDDLIKINALVKELRRIITGS
jgi:HPt (histidine-containing phosphotransfer) domain-containing protein